MAKVYNWKPRESKYRKQQHSPFGTLPVRYVVCDNDSGQPAGAFFDRKGYPSERAAYASIGEYYSEKNEYPEGLFIRVVILPK